MAADHNCFSSAFGDFTLSRGSRTHSRTEQNLQAWDAADELLLSHLAEQGIEKDGTGTTSLLVANDTWGALLTALPPVQIAFCTDSYVAERAARENLAANGKDDAHISWFNSLGEPTKPLDYLLLKLPKNLSLLEDQLYRYRALSSEKTRIIAAGMVKHMSAGAFELFEKIIGPTHTSLAKKKARLIFCVLNSETVKQGKSPYPLRYKLEGTAIEIENHANVFSRNSLDIGTRFFLAHLPASKQPLQVADLGCGNGLVGLTLAQNMPLAQIDFYDESHMALASAASNFRRVFTERDNFSFIVDDCMSSAKDDHYDKIFCNPPFHQHQIVGDFVARQMFHDAHRCLKAGGEFWLVGNQHLGYHTHLKRIFGNVSQVASNKKFVVLRAKKS